MFPRLLSFSVAFVAAALAASPAAAGLSEVGAHMRAARTMTAEFTQTSASGQVLKGKLILARPGKVRFQYEPGVPLLVVSNGSMLSMIDYEVDQVSRWPIRSTPLAVFLDPDKELERYATVLPQRDARSVEVMARDPKHPEYGTLTMVFDRDPAAPGGLSLSSWRVLDAQGNLTRVNLSNVRFNVPVADYNFGFRDPRPRRQGGRL